MAAGEATEDHDKTMCDEWMVVRDEDWIHNNLSAFASQHVHLLVLSSAGLDPFQTLRFNVPNLNIACGLVTRFCRLLSLCETNRTLYSTVARRVENYINYGHSVDRGAFMLYLVAFIITTNTTYPPPSVQQNRSREKSLAENGKCRQV